MFYHSKELQFKARVSKPDARFARLLLEQFGGGNGELKAAMQYFVQAFACHNPYPDKYDMLMDIATEELGHLEIVGATIQMLLAGVNGNLKDAAERNDVFGESISKDDFIHSAFSINPQFGVLFFLFQRRRLFHRDFQAITFANIVFNTGFHLCQPGR